MVKKSSYMAKVCMVTVCTILLGIVGFKVYKRTISYADWLENGVIKNNIPASEDNITLDFLEDKYNIPNRTISRKEPNNTGLKLVYKDKSWLYIDEYINIGKNNEVADNLNSKDIVVFDLAPGYEAILIDGTNETRILGPLRLVGKNYDEDPKGKYSINSAVTDGYIVDDYNVNSMYSKMWDYNETDCWSTPGNEVDGDPYERKNVKIYNMKKIRVKRVALRDGVYLMRDVYNVINGPDDSKGRDGMGKGAYCYIDPLVFQENFEKYKKDGRTPTLVSSDEFKTGSMVNSIMIVGNYEVRLKREKENTGKGTSEQRICIKGGKNKIVSVVDFWRLHDKGEEGAHGTNDFSSLSITSILEETGDEKTDSSFYEGCVKFYDDNEFRKIKFEYKKGKEKGYIARYEDVVKVHELPQITEDTAVTVYTGKNFTGNYMKFYRGEVYDREYANIEKIKSLEVAPNARIIFSNVKDCILSEENNGKIYSDKGDVRIVIDGPCVVEDLEKSLNMYYLDPSWTEEDDGNNKVVIEKEKDTDSTKSKENTESKEDDNKAICRRTYEDNTRAFVVEPKVEYNPFAVLYIKPNGVGTFKEFNKLGEKISLGDYYPQSIAIKGRYFAKFYDSTGKIIKTLIGPIENIRTDLLNAEETKVLESTNDNTIEDTEKLIKFYEKYKDMKVLIGASTQRDSKGRSIENVDGIVLYKDINYNSGAVAHENVWSCFRVDADTGKFIKGDSEVLDLRNKVATTKTEGGDGEDNKDVENIDTESNDIVGNEATMEVENDNIGSIKISGSLLGKYKIKLKLKGNEEEIESNNSIKDLREFVKAKEDENVIIEKITLEKLGERDEFEILIDSTNSTFNGIIKDTKKLIAVKTKDERVSKNNGTDLSDDVNYDTEERNVYLVDLFGAYDSSGSTILSKLGINYEYVYEYDVSSQKDDKLVGIKLIRNIGIPGTTNVKLKKSGDNIKTYKDVDSKVGTITREIEVKFNQNEESVAMALAGTKMAFGSNGVVGKASVGEYISSDEYNQTSECRNLVITDHGYYSGNATKVKNDSTVVSRSYRDIMEVPVMLVKEVKAKQNGKTIQYLEIATEEDVANTGEATIHLYVPVKYTQNKKTEKSYLMSQLGF
ncbi:MAG: hypothetical protein J6Y29_06730 [Clostridiales bacterium]|nr:hypothetical protein [Clostridiales bacterium]